MNIRRYFDLSQPATFRSAAPPLAAPAAEGAAIAAAELPAAQMSLEWQIATYLILLISIVASRFLDLYRVGVPAKFGLDWQYLSFIAIASLLAFPVVYDKARFSRDQPAMLQICLIFTAGMGWEKILATVVGK